MPATHNQWAEVALFTQVSISSTLRRILAVPKSVVFCNFSIAISVFSCSILFPSSVVIDPRAPTIMGIMSIFFMRHNLLISLFNKSYRCLLFLLPSLQFYYHQDMQRLQSDISVVVYQLERCWASCVRSFYHIES